MLRREFLILSAAAALIPALTPAAARAGGTAYSPDLLKAEMAAGKTILLDFKADWCSTCKAQERVINALRAENPAYDRAISFIDVDWDKWQGSDLVNARNVPRRSTLIVLKGETEIGRIVADTSPKAIRALMDLALKSAGA